MAGSDERNKATLPRYFDTRDRTHQLVQPTTSRMTASLPQMSLPSPRLRQSFPCQVTSYSLWLRAFAPPLDDSTYRMGERIKINRLVHKFTGPQCQDMRFFGVILG